uniref:Putative methyltransferase n=1 Tax=viral metagenome TaxID=1070528 RepID=A0A6H1ZTB0_9ZZZZ
METQQQCGKVKIRRLTPRECERLMSWPDDWTRWGINENGDKVEMSDTQRYKMCGNGVVSEVVKAVFSSCINQDEV